MMDGYSTRKIKHEKKTSARRGLLLCSLANYAILTNGIIQNISHSKLMNE